MTTIPHPRETQHMVGHAAAVAEFTAAWQGGRVHHAWLLTGAGGIGKATLAYALARWVMAADRPETQLSLPPAHTVVKQVSAGSCPSLCVIEPEADEKSGVLRDIGVGEARRIAPFLRLTAADNTWRVVLIDGVDHMTNEAQNAILKVLEEPPPRCVMFFTASQPGRLLPTIRSRTRLLKLQSLSDNELRNLAARLDVSLQGHKPWLLKHAGGSIGELIHLVELDAGSLHDMVEGIVRNLPNVNWQDVHKLAEKVGRKENDLQFRLVLELLNSALAEKLLRMPAAASMWGEVQTKLQTATERHLDRTATLIDVVGFAGRSMQQSMGMAA